MKNTKRLTAVLLSVLLTLTVILSVLVMPVAANESADSALLFHYDFENTGDGVYANKAPRESGASKDALILSSADSAAFTVENGTVTANWDSSAMRVDASENTKAVQEAENSTWFFRFKVPALDSGEHAGKEVIIDFRHRTAVARPLWIAAKWKTLTPDVQINGSVVANQVGETGHDWVPNEWTNLAVVREGNVSTVYYISDDGSTVTRMYTSTSAVVAAENFGFSFFREWNETNVKYETYTYAKGMSYDDIRFYTVALDEAGLKGIVADLLQPTTPPVEDTTNEPTPDATDAPAPGVTNEPTSTPTEEKAPATEPTVSTEANKPAVTTQTPTTSKEDAPKDPTAEGSAEQTASASNSSEKGGCGSVVGGAALGTLLLIGIAVIPCTKRH